MLRRTLCSAALIGLGTGVLGCTGEIDERSAVDAPIGAEPGGLGGANGGTSGGMGGGNPQPTDPAATPACALDDELSPGRAPLRRLTRFEYDNTVRDLLGDDTNPAAAFPSEELGNGFGNEADAQSVSSLLAEQYSAVSEQIAQRATETAQRLGQLAACASEVTDATDAATEQACARDVIEGFVPRAYRRPLEPGEADELLAFQQSMRATATFAPSLAAVIELVLQSPDFLYRLEWGALEPGALEPVRRPTGPEMATRLAYFLWQTMPDDALRDAALAGELSTAQGVRAQAERMLDDERARPMLRFFFDNLLPIVGLADLERDSELFPTFSPAIGGLMREETQRFLEYEIFEGPGSWQSALTAPYTFVNEELASFYGISGVRGEEFQKVPLDTTQRLGLLTQAGMLAGTAHSNTTSPVIRGAYIVRKLMCTEIPLPTAELLGEDVFAKIKPPEPYSGDTARERYSAHSEDPICASCHTSMDPIGLALENYDPVGLWRDQENGVTIDASGAVPGTQGSVSGPVELVRKIAATEQVQSCFSSHWLTFAYGRVLDERDECTRQSVLSAFEASGHDVRALLLALTQTDAFLYMPAEGE